ncbi:hypothetical protein FA15DRAFT_664110 [Coprinopsis marcescibilis]|uniref:Uncharacterized protein n=1 Tax=Coprinopsis marcescibilis TaxID=230819 RepID=A0A5C3LAC7_COPMA|nr:hypothetical protein FA15DRAFT_664110 [Coprinopsis marcescibilis]
MDTSSWSSFFHRPQLKSKVAIKSPFGKRKVDDPSPGPSNSSISSAERPESRGVIDISEPVGRRSSLDFCDSATPSLDYGARPLYTRSQTRVTSQQIQLQLDLGTEKPFSDWLTQSLGFQSSPPANEAGRSNAVTERHQEEEEEEVEDDEFVTDGGVWNDMNNLSSREVVAHLEALDSSSFGTLSRDVTPKKPQSNPLKIATQPEDLDPSDDALLQDASHLISSMASPLNSAVSGTSLARQLMANGFSLSHDRSSRYRSFGLTRSDSTTLPIGDRPSDRERFEVGPEAPPIPANAESIYVPPKTPRTPNYTKNRVKRRGSTGSIIEKQDSELVSPITRPNSQILSPTDPEDLYPSLSPYQNSPSPDANYKEYQDLFQERRHIPPAIDLNAAQSNARSKFSNVHSTSPSSSNISPGSDVLDYYSFAGAPEGFRPPFTPITEESLSQMTPSSTPLRNEKRDSHRPAGARSPMKHARGQRPVPYPARRPSDSGLPSHSPQTIVPERPHSVQFSSSSNEGHRPNPSISSLASLNDPLPEPPSFNTIFNGRQRSGSTPSPIKVVKYPNDSSRGKYAIELEQSGSNDASPVSGGSGSVGDQTFPESAMSNGWSIASPMVPGMETIARSDVPLSAALPGITNGQPSLAHQMLLSRAQSTKLDRHSRQGSFSMLPPKRPSGSPLVKQKILEDEEDPDSTSSTIVVEEVSQSSSQPTKRSLPSSPGQPLQPPLAANPQGLLPPSVPFTHTVISSTTGTRPVSVSSGADRSDAVSISTQGSNDSSGLLRIKSLPPLPTSPPPSSASSNSSQQPRGPRVPPRVPPSLELPSPPLSGQTTSESAPIRTTGSSSSSSRASMEPPSALLLSPPPASALHPFNRGSTNTIDALLHDSMSSPPPSYSVFDQHTSMQIQPSPVPSTPSELPYRQPLSPPELTISISQASLTPSEGLRTSGSRDSTVPGRPRQRPPLPAGPRVVGPRGPAGLQNVGSPIVQATTSTRERSGSTTSLGPRQPSTRRVTRPAAPQSPKFQTPAVRWKGYTLEVAKWTFSSSQLQDIVSRAIRESALSSSIRLLKLDSLDTDIPAELHRLEMHRTDVKAKYKALVRRRTLLFESLSLQFTHTSEESSTIGAHIVEQLKDVSRSLDSLAEELHVADEQIGQLNTLVQVHCSSALSVALRKLNGSLMKQKEENDFLRERNVYLEQERDEAWSQAQNIADEYDSNFSDRGDTSRRSSHVSAKRKSSATLSKAGLRSRRQSHRSSLASSMFGGQTPLTSRSQFSQFDSIPPMPPIPRRRPNVLTIYEPPLKSSGALSPNYVTPDSETNAIVSELYTMLGLPPDTAASSARIKRSRSITALPSAGLSPPPMSARFETFAARQRRSSLPGQSAINEVHNASDVESHAVLATLARLHEDPI